jgi:hypothetical protein
LGDKNKVLDIGAQVPFSGMDAQRLIAVEVQFARHPRRLVGRKPDTNRKRLSRIYQAVRS